MTLHIVGKVKSEHSSEYEIRISRGGGNQKLETGNQKPNRTVTLPANVSYSRHCTDFKVLCVRNGLQIMMHIAWDGEHGVS